jgi:hypothetical protein
MTPNKRMQPTSQPVIKFAYANLSPVWAAADAGCWADENQSRAKERNQ